MTSHRKHVDHCLNCGAETPGAFCPSCGQEAVDAAVTFRDQLADFFAEVFTVESRLPQSVKLLLTRPGELTRAYNSGQRVRYVTPLKVYLFTSVAFFLVLSFASARERARAGGEGGRIFELHVNLDAPVPSAGPSAPPASSISPGGALPPAPPPANANANASGGARKTHEATADDFDEWMKDPAHAARVPAIFVPRVRSLLASPEGFAAALVEMLSKATAALVPLHALLLKLLYWRRRGPRRLYGEHIVFSLHVHSFGYLAFGTSQLVGAFGNVGVSNAAGTLALVLIAAYLVRAARVAYAEGLGLSLLKTTAAALGYSVALAGVIVLAAVVTFLAS